MDINNKRLKISVVTVCYNAVGIIEDTIQSVINQTYPELEYIIIDGGSTDGTVDIIKRYSSKLTYWVSEPDKGIYDAMNKGIKAASGAYINFMNAGDRFYDNEVLKKFASQADENCKIIFGDWVIKLDNLFEYRKPLSIKYLDTKLMFTHQAVFVSLSYHKMNLFDTRYKLAADYNLVYNAVKRDNAKLQYLPFPIAIYDVSPGNTTNDNGCKLLREKFSIWGIENNYLKKSYWYGMFFRTWLSKKIRDRLPAGMVLKIKNYLDKKRDHIS